MRREPADHREQRQGGEEGRSQRDAEQLEGGGEIAPREAHGLGEIVLGRVQRHPDVADLGLGGAQAVLVGEQDVEAHGHGPAQGTQNDDAPDPREEAQGPVERVEEGVGEIEEPVQEEAFSRVPAGAAASAACTASVAGPFLRRSSARIGQNRTAPSASATATITPHRAPSMVMPAPGPI